MLDLDLPEYIGQDDLADYARRLLLANGDPGRTTPYQADHALTRRVAVAAIASRANRCYLVARIVARTLANAPEVVDVRRPEWSEFPEEVGQAFDDYLEQFGDSTRRVRRLLAPLVYGEAPACLATKSGPGWLRRCPASRAVTKISAGDRTMRART